MLERILGFLLPSNDINEMDLYEYKNRKLFVSFNFIAFCSILIFTFSHFIQGRETTAIVNSIGLLISFSSLLIYKKKSLYEISVALFLTATLWVIGAQHYLAPSTMKSNLIWLPLLTLISFFFVRPKIATLLTCLTLIVGILTEILPNFFPIKGDTFSDIDKYTLEVLTILGTIVVGHFIGKRISSEEMSIYTQLNKRNNELLELSETNAVLVSILGHDLANQVALGALNVHKIKKSENSDLGEPIEKISKSFKEIDKIIKNVLILQSHSSDKVKLELRSVNLMMAINTALEIVEEKAKIKNLKFKIDNLTKNNQISILSDPTSLVHSVFINILTNAIKFSRDDGEINISIEDNIEYIRVRFRDHGIGIPKDILDNIFCSTSMTSRPGTQGEKGTGFGMPILKMFMDKYNANIQVTSNTHKDPGTEFILDFQPYK